MEINYGKEGFMNHCLKGIFVFDDDSYCQSSSRQSNELEQLYEEIHGKDIFFIANEGEI